MSEDYKKGFKDGFAAGLEEGKKLGQPKIGLGDYFFGVNETCPKCHMRINRAMGYVCASPNCPTFPQITCGVPMTGAVGSEVSVTYAAGANGPSGPQGPKPYDPKTNGWSIFE